MAELKKIDHAGWSYNKEDDVFYQTGIQYCEEPADEQLQTLSVFVPGKYFSACENGDGTYTCEINPAGTVNGYTAAAAPVVMPVHTPGYRAQEALASYTSVSGYTDAGFVYLHAGCRGRESGAPAGVTDLKAALRYFRYCGDLVPGDKNAVFTFGMSGGGAQSALMGTTGDSCLYEPYLTAIGAVSGISDAVRGSMCWCPVTNLDTADAAYEWMLGVTRTGLPEEEQKISAQLAESFAEYINKIGLKDKDGFLLKLESSEAGIYQAGTYYDAMKTVIEESLNHFLEDTVFPYNAAAVSGHGPGERFPGGREMIFENMDDIARKKPISSGLSLSGTYETPQQYIDALNSNSEWVMYDHETNTASIKDIKSFVIPLKQASKSIGAFDQLDGGQGENILFGYGDGKGAHFDAMLADVLSGLNYKEAEKFDYDLQRTDSAGNTVQTRVNMYTPLYYLLECSEGYQTSTIAKYWRIRSGINQGDCALSTEMNLALALENYNGIETVDFETVWGQRHVKAERTGDPENNFIHWVENCTR